MGSSETMEWLTNIYNPELPDAKWYIPFSPYQTQGQAWEAHLKYLKDKIIGRPKANMMTVEELEARDLVGVYKK